jgi:hypothetical protein
MDELVVLFFELDGYRRLAQLDSIPPAEDLDSPNGSKITVSLAASSQFYQQLQDKVIFQLQKCR